MSQKNAGILLVCSVFHLLIIEVVFKWYHMCWFWFFTVYFGCSSHVRRPNETMRLLVTTFVGIVFGFFLGVSFPTISLTKAGRILVFHFPASAYLQANCFNNLLSWHLLMSYFYMILIQMSIPSGLLPSIDLTYIENKYPGLSTQALLNVWSSLKGTKDNPQKLNISEASYSRSCIFVVLPFHVFWSTS